MKRGHLASRPCRGRSIAWSRVPEVSGGQVVAIHYHLFRRLAHNQATVCQSRIFTLVELACARAGGRSAIASQLVVMRSQLRWRVQQLQAAH